MFVKRNASRIAAVFLAAVVALAVAFSAVAAQTGSQSLQRAVDRLVAEGAPGAIVLVRDGNRIRRVTGGYANVERRTPMKAGDRFRAGSVTKTFVATVVLELAGERKLALDDSIGRWLPGVVPNGDRITLRQLLNHTSGLFDYVEDPAVLAPYRQGHAGYVWTPAELLRIAFRHGPLFAPGTRWAYSNTNYILLGLVVEKATGRSLAHELERRIIQPLGLHATTLGTTPRLAGAHAAGYVRADGRLVELAMSPSPAWAAAAIVSNADDVARFYRALLDGRLLSRPLLREMQTTVPAQGTAGYGLGLMEQRTPCGAVWGHVGEFPGYTASAFSSRDGDHQIVMVVNASQDSLSPQARRTMWQAFELAHCG